MKLGSLCSGFGGLDLAVEAHYGATTVWHAETDKDCAKVLAHHWPGVPNLGDLTLIDWGLVEGVDILTGGYPCQPYSHAGRRKGEDDERAIFAYIGDAVSVLRPRVCVFENVAGHLTLGGPGVIATLTELGYDTRWGVVRASDAPVFAPHRRARWFCIARNTDDSDIGPFGRVQERSSTEPAGTSRAAADADGDRGGLSPGSGSTNCERPTDPTDRSNPVAAADSGSERHGPRQNHLLVGRLDGQDRRAWGQSRHRDATPAADFGPYDEAVRRWEYILGRPAPAPTDDRGLRPEFVEWMMGLPEGWVCDLGLSRTAALKMLGNGVVPQQAALAVDLLL